MIVTENDIEKKMFICYVCGKLLKVGDSYEKITTYSKKKIVVHTDCICGKGENNVKN